MANLQSTRKFDRVDSPVRKLQNRGEDTVSIVKNFKYAEEVINMLILTGMKSGLQTTLKKVVPCNGHFCGVILMFSKEKYRKKDFPKYFICCEQYSKLSHYVQSLTESDSPLRIVLNPISYQKCIEAKLHPDKSEDEFLGVTMLEYRSPENKHVVYCGLEKRVIVEKTRILVNDLLRNRGGEGREEVCSGEKESDMVRHFLNSETERLFWDSNEKSELKLDSSDLKSKIRQRLFGLINFRPRTPTKDFVGRKGELEELRRMLGGQSEKERFAKSMVAITGTPGVGKSELAIQFVEANGEHYDNYVWIDSSTRESAESSFKELARTELRTLPKGTDGTPKDIRTIVDDVYHFFRNKRTLFVFDDVRDLECVFLPKSANQCTPHVIITSRKRNWTNVTVMVLEPLKDQEAEELVGVGGNNRSSDGHSLAMDARVTENNPWLLKRFSKDRRKEDSTIHSRKELTDKFARVLDEAFPENDARAIGSRLDLTERDGMFLDSTLKSLSEGSCGRMPLDILRELVLSKESSIYTGELLIMGVDFDLMCKSVQLLIDNSLAEIVDRRLKIHCVVKVIHLWKTTIEGRPV